MQIKQSRWNCMDLHPNSKFKGKVQVIFYSILQFLIVPDGQRGLNFVAHHKILWVESMKCLQSHQGSQEFQYILLPLKPWGVLLFIMTQISHDKKFFVPFIDSPRLLCNVEKSSGKCLHHMRITVVFIRSSAQRSGIAVFSQVSVPTELIP